MVGSTQNSFKGISPSVARNSGINNAGGSSRSKRDFDLKVQVRESQADFESDNDSPTGSVVSFSRSMNTAGLSNAQHELLSPSPLTKAHSLMGRKQRSRDRKKPGTKKSTSSANRSLGNQRLPSREDPPSADDERFKPFQLNLPKSKTEALPLE